ncbi:uncharacterized protein IUM83_13235 [Phytophthora cinnamomi]|uniref:uncharacterized protein n=1 Tax=Phytophthora cinnamomi TaxID=4785 RepID=UPI00355A63CE|nr:hypothetical protein IUM83_13235 [Phytophthora cinnamomi]
MASSMNWQWINAVTNRAVSWWPSTVNYVGQPVALQQMQEHEHLKAEKCGAQRLIAELNEQLKCEQETKARLTQKVVDLEELVDLEKQKNAVLEARADQALIAALKKRLKEEQDAKAVLEQAISDEHKLQQERLEDMEHLRAADKAEITRLKKRFNQRKVAAEIANLEKEVSKLKKQVSVLKMEKKVYDKNQLLALQVQKNHRCSQNMMTKSDK